MGKKRLFQLGVIVLILLFSSSISFGTKLVQSSSPALGIFNELTEECKGTNRLFLEMFVGCIRYDNEEGYVLGIPFYNSEFFTDLGTGNVIEGKKPLPPLTGIWANYPNTFAKEPTLSIPYYDNPSNIRKARMYEAYSKVLPDGTTFNGACRLFAYYKHDYCNDEVVFHEEIIKEDKTFFCSQPQPKDTFPWPEEQYGFGEPVSRALSLKNQYLYSVDWDNVPSDCNNLKGTSNGNSCCGDDYMWIMNSVHNIDETVDKNIDDWCLYSYIDEDEEALFDFHEDQFGFEDAAVGPHPYRNGVYCTPLRSIAAAGDIQEIHYAYDSKLLLYSPDSDAEEDRLFRYYYDDPGTTTDVGLWEEPNLNPRYCHHYFLEGTGDIFEWTNSKQAGEIHYFDVKDDSNNDGISSSNIPKKVDNDKKFVLNPKAPDYIYDVMTKTDHFPKLNEYDSDGDGIDSDDLNICNLFLDGEWTGHHCCGNKFDAGENKQESFNDPYENGKHYFLDKSDLQEYEFEIKEDNLKPNKACYKGETASGGEIVNDPYDPIYFKSDNLGNFNCGYLNEGDILMGIFNGVSLGDLNLDVKTCCNIKYPNFKLNPKQVGTTEKNGFDWDLYDCGHVASLLNEKGTLKYCVDEERRKEELILGKTIDLDHIGLKYTYDALQVSTDYLLFGSVNDAPHPLALKLNIGDNGINDNVYNKCESTYLTKDYHMLEDDYEDNDVFYYCHTNNSWLSIPISDQQLSKGTSSAPTPFGMLGRIPQEGDKLYEVDEPKEIGFAHAKSSGCCFENECWTGKKCVPNGYIFEDVDVTHTCSYGDWGVGDPSYNWYDEQFDGDTSVAIGVQYCTDKWSCACPKDDKYSAITSEEDGWTIDECEKYTTPGKWCTRFPWTYVGDRFCEVTDQTNIVDADTYEEAAWTTRTKYLATAMLDIPTTDNYVLHCDDPGNIFNFYPQASKYWDEYIKDGMFSENYNYDIMNNFCVLLINPGDNEEVYVGTTLNPLLDYSSVTQSLYSDESEENIDTECFDDNGEEDYCTATFGDVDAGPTFVCYRPLVSSAGQCKLKPGSQEACDDYYGGLNMGEHTWEADDINDPDTFGVCIPKGPDFMEMLNVTEYMTQILYGEDDKKGLVNSPYLFNQDQGADPDFCDETAELTNFASNTDFLMFKQCDETNIAYNDVAKAIIFTKKAGIVNPITLTYQQVHNSKLTTYADEFKQFVVDNAVEIQDWGENIDLMKSISDFDRIYYYQDASRKIFGMLERKSNPLLSPSSNDYANKLEYFYAIKYEGFDNLFYNYDTTLGEKKCSIVKDEYAPFKDIGCFREDALLFPNNYFLISPPMENYYSDNNGNPYISEFWFDLTAKLRVIK
ncbi:hypothetical protein HOC35_02085 [Candidatus Woesearchaeota archaeon]|nr:hypothetical protein [Candidatus Woesearchaeota archaeon]